MNTQANNIHVQKVTSPQQIDAIAQHVTQRQKTPDFMRFLKEKPMSISENTEVLQKECTGEKNTLFSVTMDGEEKIVWILLFHNFSSEQKSVELGFRMDPELQRKWICTQAVQQAIQEVFADADVECIEGRHSALNKWSFFVFHKAGFSIEKFVPEQTFLQNIEIQTDDFQRIMKRNTQEEELIDTLHHKKIPIRADDTIKKWLQKHGFIQ